MLCPSSSCHLCVSHACPYHSYCSLRLQGRSLGYRSLPGIITPPIPTPGDPEMEDEDLFLPLVIVWSPYLTYPTLFPPGSLQCPSCGCALQHSYWNDGSSSTSQPRLLHDIHNVALLVSATYICENRHRVLAHDECILKCFTAQRMIPFVLLFRTGFTLEFIDTCMALVTRGLNFYNIESFITEKRWETFARQQDMLTLHKTMTGQNAQTSDFLTSQYYKIPSNDLISKCFLARFLQDEQVYLKEMMAVPTGETISFDHTFKVAANIGFYREDGKWIYQYDSLFIVMNGNGQVITWQLTKGTAFSQVATLLKDLKERSPMIRTVYIEFVGGTVVQV